MYFIRTLASLLAFGAFSNLHAATFTANQGGLTGTSSTIRADGTGDYTSLYQAGLDFSTYLPFSPGGAKGSYTFYIDSDLTETQPVAFGNRTNGHTIELRPTGVPRTITFESPQGYDATGIFAHLWVGATMPLGFSQNESGKLKDTSNFHIIGTLPGHAYGLTFIGGPDQDEKQSGRRDTIRVIGQADNFILKDCRVDNVYESTARSHAVSLMGYGSLQPDNAGIAGCLLVALGTHGVGLGTENIRPQFSQQTCSALTIEQCGIAAPYLPVHLVAASAINVINNYIHLPVEHHPIASVGISHSAPYGSTSPDSPSEISGNRIVLQGGENALLMQGIRLAAQAETTQSLTRIFNNMIAFDTEPANYSRHVAGISSVFNPSNLLSIAHNSVTLPPQADALEQQAVNYHGIGVQYASVAPRIVNNIVHTPTSGTVCLYSETTMSVVADGNVWSATGNALAVATAATSYSLLANWRGDSGQDQNSQTTDMSDMWASASDLHLVGAEGELQPGIAMGVGPDTVTYDFDGEGRALLAPTPGADELTGTAERADLVPTITGVVTKSISRKKQPATKFTIYVEVANVGSIKASKSKGIAGLSSGSTLQPNDTQFAFRIPALKPGKTVIRKIKKVVSGNVTGTTAIAEVDTSNVVVEKQEANNVAIFGPIQ